MLAAFREGDGAGATPSEASPSPIDAVALISQAIEEVEAEDGWAALAAVGVRLSTLWFSILCGLLSIAVLEAVAARRGGSSVRDGTEGGGTGR